MCDGLYLGPNGGPVPPNHPWENPAIVPEKEIMYLDKWYRIQVTVRNRKEYPMPCKLELYWTETHKIQALPSRLIGTAEGLFVPQRDDVNHVDGATTMPFFWNPGRNPQLCDQKRVALYARVYHNSVDVPLSDAPCGGGQPDDANPLGDSQSAFYRIYLENPQRLGRTPE
jgi:hypothetical protein